MNENSLGKQEQLDVKVEIAKPEDWEAYRDIRIEALTENPEAFRNTLDKALAESPESWKAKLSSPDVFIVLAKIGSGSCEAQSVSGASKRESDSWKIVNTYTRPKFRRKGLSEKILREVLEEIKRRGGKKAYIKVSKNPKQEAARAVYTKLGFKFTKEETEDRYFMELDLTK